MSLTPPKRLFDINLMKTVMYDDVKSDVQENGYAAISHVWGKQWKYWPTLLGIRGGVNWNVPLSNYNKVNRVKNAMKEHGKRYCWWDVLCMNQDKQSEINEEIPFMGDYYSGADMTLVISTVDYNKSNDFTKLCEIVDDCIAKNRNPTYEESGWISLRKSSMIDFSKEQWFERVWTLQETVLSKNIVFACVDGSYLNLSHIFTVVSSLKNMSLVYNYHVFSDFSYHIENLCQAYFNHTKMDVKYVMYLTSTRNCNNPLDKFYGVFGILEYKDFVVDYEKNSRDLGKKLAQYAYSKGDLSWIAIGGSFWPGFVQPLYSPSYIGDSWKEEEPGSCKITFRDDLLSTNVALFAKVMSSESCASSSVEAADFIPWLARIYKTWNFNEVHVAASVIQFKRISNDAMSNLVIRLLSIIENMDPVQIFTAFLTASAINVSPDDLPEFMSSHHDKWIENSSVASKCILDVSVMCPMITAVKIVTITGDIIPMIVFGKADRGDNILFTKLRDDHNRALGIIVCGSEKKGLCVCEMLEIPDELYSSREFSL